MMKRIICSLALLIALPLSAKTYDFNLASERVTKDVSVEQVRGATNVNFTISTMETENASVPVPSIVPFQKLMFRDLDLSTVEGRPALPFKTLIVRGYPQNIEVEQDLGQEIVLNDVLPLPAQQTKMRCDGCERINDFSINWDEYAKEESLVEKEYIGDFRGIPLTKVTIYPASFNVNDGFRIYPEARFTVTSTSRYFENFKDPENLLLEANLNKNYMVIAPSSFVQTVTEFKQWKESLGYKVSIYTLEEAGSTYDKVKAFIKTKYDEQKFTYAVLVGTETIFPTGSAATSGSAKTPSDLLYWTMGGATDFIPDVMAGRFVVSNVTELKNQIAKIKEYEQGTFADKSGLTRHIGIASNEGSGPSDVEYVEMMAKPFNDTFKLTTKFFLQKNSDSTATNIINELSKGIHWVSYIGHGSGTSWPSISSGQVTASQLQNISAGVVKPIVIDVACMNGNFNTNKFGERFMNSTNGGKPTGAVAYYGGSVNISWHPPAKMAVGISRLMVKKSLKHLGEVLFAGQMYLYSNNSNVEESKDNLEWYHLFGDPSMKLSLGQSVEPTPTPNPTPTPTPVDPTPVGTLKNFTVSHGLFSLTVYDESYKKIAGAKVTFKKGTQTKVLYTDSVGVVSYPWYWGASYTVEADGFKPYSGSY